MVSQVPDRQMLNKCFYLSFQRREGYLPAYSESNEAAHSFNYNLSGYLFES